jgi:hypothetical protein
VPLELLNERLVLFSKTRDYWPVQPTPHIAQFHRWRLKGLLNARKDRVKLETILLGGRRYTSHEAVERFIAGINDERPRVSTQRAKEVSIALDAILNSYRSKKARQK